MRTSIEGKRGCGYRQAGGLYLVCEGLGQPCGALPIPLNVCPTCNAGIKPARGWTWINLAQFAGQTQCRSLSCGSCPIADAAIQNVGLLWVGEKFYATPGDFTREADAMGVSRRIKAVPKGFEVGKTWVALAHRHAIYVGTEFKLENEVTKAERVAGIFHLFRPQRIEYVVRGTESKDTLDDLEKRGITPVKVERK